MENDPKQEKLQQIFSFFASRALKAPWNISQQVSIHLSPDIVQFIVDKWPEIHDQPLARAGFIQALLCTPRKKIGPEMQPVARKLGKLGIKDQNEYVRLVAQILLGFTDDGFIDIKSLESPTVDRIVSAILPSRSNKKTFKILARNARYMDARYTGFLSTGEYAEEPLISFSCAAQIPAFSDRIKSYGMPEDYSLEDFAFTPLSFSSASMPVPASDDSSSLKRKASLLLGSQRLGIPKRQSSQGGFSSSKKSGGLEAKKSKYLSPKRHTSMILDLDDTKMLDRSVEEQQKRREDEARLEREAKIREKEADQQKRVTAREQAAELKRVKQLRIENDRQQRQAQSESKNVESPVTPVAPAALAIPPTQYAPATVDMVLAGSENVSDQDFEIVRDFLAGRYGITILTKSRSKTLMKSP